MGATQRQFENASKYGLAERDVRALTEYLTVLEDVGRARDAEGLYLVVSQSGREYLVDAEGRACECDDFRFRRGECKHLRRVAFATGERAIPTAAAIELDVDPSMGEHVDADRRYVSTDGGEPVAGEATNEREDSWLVRDRERDRIREFETRAAAEHAIDDLEGLGLDVELLAPEDGAEADARDDPGSPAEAVPEEGATGEVAADGEAAEEGTTDERVLDERTVADDPLDWLPAAFVDWIDGTPAINRKGFEVLGHFYDVDVETEVQVGPADTDFEYAQVKATATMPDGRRCEALASAHVDRDDDRGLLLELADTRARKRAISIATGVGAVAVEELKHEAQRA